jgi:hypothetical protein
VAQVIELLVGKCEDLSPNSSSMKKKERKRRGRKKRGGAPEGSSCFRTLVSSRPHSKHFIHSICAIRQHWHHFH